MSLYLDRISDYYKAQAEAMERGSKAKEKGEMVNDTQLFNQFGIVPKKVQRKVE